MDELSFGAAMGAVAVGLGWVLVERLKKAKRIMPRTRVSLHLSMESPSSEPSPPSGDAPLSFEPAPFPGQSTPPIILTSGRPAPLRAPVPAIVIHVESDQPIHAEAIPPPKPPRDES